MGPTRLSDYPWVVVNVSCRLCRRRGRYRLARLAAKYGSEIDLERLLELLAADCKWMRPGVRPRNYEARCGVRFPDIDGSRPPPDLLAAMRPDGSPGLKIVGGRG